MYFIKQKRICYNGLDCGKPKSTKIQAPQDCNYMKTVCDLGAVNVKSPASIQCR